MTLNQIARTLSLECLAPAPADGASAIPDAAGPAASSVEVKGAHASDLLSDVLANAPVGGILLTIQVHMNVIAVAVHAGLSAVVFTSGMRPDDAVRDKAAEEGIPLYCSAETTFDVAGKLYALGLRGREPRGAA